MASTPKYHNLVAKAKKGDLQAKHSLYLATVDLVYQSSFRLTNCRAAAKDATQDAFIRAFDRLDSLVEAESFPSWVRRIAVNICLQIKKKQMHFVSVDNLEVEDQGESRLDIDWNTIDQAIRSLPESCQTIFNLYVIEEYQHSQIAELLSISVGTSKSQLHYAKKLLREKLNPITQR